MNPDITSLRRLWHQLELGSDIEFWEMSPADFKFLVSIKLDLNTGSVINRKYLNDLINNFQEYGHTGENNE